MRVQERTHTSYYEYSRLGSPGPSLFDELELEPVTTAREIPDDPTKWVELAEEVRKQVSLRPSFSYLSYCHNSYCLRGPEFRFCAY